MGDNDNSSDANSSQVEYWNATAGPKWVQYRNVLDALMVMVTARLLEKSAPVPGEKVLEIGCGAGALAMRVAAQVGAAGSVLGLDISQPLLDSAESHKTSLQNNNGNNNISFLMADAQSHKFDAEAFDLLISRFGVMFFSDPVAAFKNMAAALRPGGRVSFVCWAPISENPWFKIPRDAAISRLGDPAAAPQAAPGPMAFADENRVLGILENAGFSSCRAETEKVNLLFEGTAKDAASMACSLGAAVRIINELNGNDSDIEAIKDKVHEDFKEYATGNAVHIPATFHFFGAVKG